MKTREPILLDPLFSDKFFEFDLTADKELTIKPNFPVPSAPEKLSEFFAITSTDGKIYKAVLKQAYQQLAKWATEHNLDSQVIADWNYAFETKYCNYDAEEHIKLNKINFPFFTIGIPTLVELNKLLNSDHKFPPGFCEFVITSMMKDIMFCGPAGYNFITEAYLAVLGQVNRAARWLVYRREKAKEVVAQIIAEYNIIELGMPIHYGIEVLNQFIDELHINKIEDEYAGELHSWIIEPSKAKFPEQMSGKINVEDFIKTLVSDFEFSVIAFLNKVNQNPNNINPAEEEFSAKLAQFGLENKDKLIYFSDDVITSKDWMTYSAVWSRYYTIYLSVFMRIAEDGYFNLNLMQEESLPGTKDIVHYFPDHTLNLAYVHLAKPDGEKHYKPFLPYCINKLSAEPNEELIQFIATLNDKQKLDVLEAVKLFLNSDKFKNSKKSTQKADNLVKLLLRAWPNTNEWDKYLATLPQQMSLILLADVKFIVTKIIPHIKTKEQFEFIFDHLSKMNESDQLSILKAIAQTKYSEHSPLSIVLANDQLKIAYRLLEFGVDPNPLGTNDDYLPIHICARDGEFEFLKLLVEKYNVNPDTLDKSKNTALFHAGRSQSEDIIEYLLSKKANPNLGELKPIIMAISANNTPLVEMLLKAHADPNLADIKGTFAIDLAVQRNQTELVKLLLENGAIPRGLIIAIQNKSLEIAKLLIQYKIDIDEVNSKGSNSLHIAVHEKNLELAQLLLANKANPNIQNTLGLSPLIIAGKQFNSDMIQLLLDNGANPNLIDSAGKPALSYVIAAKKMDLAKLLLEHKADPDPALIAAATNGDKETIENLLKILNPSQLNAKALSEAFREGYMDIVELFLVANPDLINHVDSDCLTSRTISCVLIEYDEEKSQQYFIWIETLLKNKVSPNAPTSGNYAHQSPIFTSIGSKYFSLLVSYQADLNVVSSGNDTPLMIAAFRGYINDVKLLLTQKVGLDIISEYGTALNVAASEGHFDVVQLLLAHGADPNLGVKGENALISAVKGTIADSNPYKVLIFPELVKLLLEKVNPELADDTGQTPLMYAVKAKRSDLVKILLTKADLNSALALTAENNDIAMTEMILKEIQPSQVNATALSVAFREGNMNVVKLFLAMNPDLINSVDNNCLTVRTIQSITKTNDEEEKKQYFAWIESLLKNKVNPNGPNSGTYANKPPIIYSFGTPYFSLLVSYQANLNVITASRETPLSIAAYYDYIDDVKLLLSHKVDLNFVSPYGTALNAAAERGNKEIVKLLLASGADPSLGVKGEDALISAVKGAIKNINPNKNSIYHELISLLLDKIDPNKFDDSDNSALSYAVEANRMDLVKILLTKADPNARNDLGDTVLLHAYKNPEMLQLLLDHKADPTIFGSKTALAAAVKEGVIESVQLLIQYHHNLNDRDFAGMIISNALVGLENNLNQFQQYLGIIKMLIQHNADLNFVDHEGVSLLTKAEKLNIPELTSLFKSAIELNEKISEEKPDAIRYPALIKLREILTTDDEKNYQHAANLLNEIDGIAKELTTRNTEQKIQSQLNDFVQTAYQDFIAEKNYQSNADGILSKLNANIEKLPSAKISSGGMFAQAKEKNSKEEVSYMLKYKNPKKFNPSNE